MSPAARIVLAIFLPFLWNSTGFSVDEVRFLAYNLQNYFVRSAQTDAPSVTLKSEKSIAALISIIAAEKPDIIGVCEMGAATDFADFQARLQRAGLDFPFSEYVEASDAERHLALLSRFPILTRNSQTDLSFDVNGRKQFYKRGILDVVLAITPDYTLHCVGTHLKSKREVPEDQALLRRAEAHLLRLHCKSILEKSPADRLLVYGDFNDTINEAPLAEITGSRTSSDHLTAVPLADENGENWTHFWDIADTYSRIDYVLASQGLMRDLDRAASHIPNPRNWNVASDHRPLVVVLRTQKR